MTLKIFYEFKTNPALIPVYNQSTSYLLDNWCQAAAERLGHKIPELIKNHYTKLAGLNILNPGLIKYSAPFSINSVVTNLGYRLGEFITKY